MPPRGVPALTFTGGHGLPDAPGAVGLAADDPLARVVVARVADEHQLGVVVVLHLVGEAPAAVLHRDAAHVGARHSWQGTEKNGTETLN